MHTIPASRLVDWSDRGSAPPVDEALRALSYGRLWDVDTGHDGHDSIAIGDDADEALAAVCEHAEITPERAMTRGWTVTRVDAID